MEQEPTKPDTKEDLRNEFLEVLHDNHLLQQKYQNRNIFDWLYSKISDFEQQLTSLKEERDRLKEENERLKDQVSGLLKF